MSLAFSPLKEAEQALTELVKPMLKEWVLVLPKPAFSELSLFHSQENYSSEHTQEF